MKYDPLTDPTSLIAYRLANRESSAPGKQRSPKDTNPPATGLAAIVGLGLLVVAITVLAHL